MNDSYYKYQKYQKKYYHLLNNINNNNNNMLQRISNNNYNKEIKNIISLADNVKIIGMAEATHGQKLITKFRIKVFKNLVKKCNYTVFILEDQYSCCELINNYIKTGIGDPDDILLQLMWFWQSIDMLKLIIWMRKFNIIHDNILEFHGLDIQYICANNNNNSTLTNFAKKKFKENNKIDQDDPVAADGYRDKSMFDIFMKIYHPSKKYFLYMHNYHIAKIDYMAIYKNRKSIKWLGMYLSNEFKENYYAIGNIFINGTYLETDNNDKFTIMNKPPVVPQIDINKIPIGLTIYNTLHASKKNNKSNISEIFDAIMIIENEEPLKLISN